MKKQNKHNDEYTSKSSKCKYFLKKNRYYIIIAALIMGITTVIFMNINYFSALINTENEIQTKQKTKNTQIDYKKIKPNEAGDILIIMYHSIDDKAKHYPWHRNKKEFREDLEYMYKNNYVLISMKEYLSNDIDIPTGKTPVLLTFDDGLRSCYSLIKNKEGKLVVNNDTLIGILEEFKAEHPDFGTGGVLYVTNNPFDYDAYYDNKSMGNYEDKFRVLKNLGYEIGNHTYNHYDMNNLSKSEITSEIGKVNNIIYKHTDKDKTVFLAYPYGSKPQKGNMQSVKAGEYKGISYNIQSAVLAAPEPPYFTNPIKKDFDPYFISRTIASNGQHMDMYWFFDYYKKHPREKYISDGDKRVLTIPKNYKNKINQTKTKSFKTVYYDPKTFKPVE
ncbi:polysaccharide deacetylase family protein [Anaerofustis sp.]|uniref:polysaccharide deacetylase family protein n=1 Tax=Anaerofustis sp. TaxID=1872517 RepID=UPI0025C16532|nr:polysaccharide deacetylase family protein [Anaerofustis sp.]